MNTLSVSTYSLRERVGRPLEFWFRGPSGKEIHFSTPYAKELELSEFPERAKTELGVDAIETSAFQFNGLDDPELDKFAQQLAANAMQLSNVAIDTGGDLGEIDPAQRAVDIAVRKRWIARFAAMGAKCVRVDAGSPASTNAYGEPPTQLIEALRELGAYATGQGTRLLVENHGGPSIDPVWMNKLLDAVGKEDCGLLLDLGNFDAVLSVVLPLFFDGDGQIYDLEQAFASVDLTPVYASINALAPRAEHVHVKAHYVSEDGTVGAVDLARAIGILGAHRYRGALSIEYEGTGGDPWAKTARVVEVTAAAARAIAR